MLVHGGRGNNNDHLRKATPSHLQLPRNHNGVWNVAALAESKEVILRESLIDVLPFWCAGYRHVTERYGVEGFTGKHLAAFQQQGIERVLIAYDQEANAYALQVRWQRRAWASSSAPPSDSAPASPSP